jgi:hypothetical protein
MCDFGPRPFLESFDLGLDVRSVLFVLPTSSIQGALRLGDRSLPSLSFLLLGGLFGAPGLRHALLCATYSRSPTLSASSICPIDPHLFKFRSACPSIASSDANDLSGIVADHKAQTLAIVPPRCTAIMFVKAYFNCVEFIRREVVPGFYLKGHIVRPRLC